MGVGIGQFEMPSVWEKNILIFKKKLSRDMNIYHGEILESGF